MIKPIPLVAFTVYGTPQPRGSKVPVIRYYGKGRPVMKDGRVVWVLRDDNPNSGPWMTTVKRAGRAAMLQGRHPEPFDGALTLVCTFFFERPKFHFNARGQLKPSAPAFPNVKPDASKCLRAIEDSLSKIVIADDARLVTSTPHKRYCDRGDPERVEIVVARLPATVEEAGAWGEKRLFQEV